MKPNERLSKNLTLEIERVNLTNDRLSHLSGVSAVTISNIRNGKANPSLEIVYKLAKGLGVETKILLR